MEDTHGARELWGAHNEPGGCGGHTRSQGAVVDTHGVRVLWRTHMEPGSCGGHTWSQSSVEDTHGARQLWWTHMESEFCGGHTWSQGIVLDTHGYARVISSSFVGNVPFCRPETITHRTHSCSLYFPVYHYALGALLSTF